MKLTRMFTVAELEEIGAPFDLPKYVAVSRTHLDDQQWASPWELLFRHDGRVWSVAYQRPATENQCCDPWFDDDRVEATTMEERQVTMTRWMPVETSGEAA